eukprot:5379960-Karenia_brevis.AAC.1
MLVRQLGNCEINWSWTAAELPIQTFEGLGVWVELLHRSGAEASAGGGLCTTCKYWKMAGQTCQG